MMMMMMIVLMMTNYKSCTETFMTTITGCGVTNDYNAGQRHSIDTLHPAAPQGTATSTSPGRWCTPVRGWPLLSKGIHLTLREPMTCEL